MPSGKDPVWKITGPLGDRGREAVRFFRAPDREQAAAAFGVKLEQVKIKRLPRHEMVGPKPPRRRR